MPKSKEEQLDKAVAGVVAACDEMFQGEGLRIIVSLQSSGEYPYQIELREETLPYASLISEEQAPATPEQLSTSVADSPSGMRQRG